MNGRRRGAALANWLYAAGFGLAAVYATVVPIRTRQQPMFFHQLRWFAGPWSLRLSRRGLTVLLLAFVVLSLVTALTGRGLWRGSRRAAGMNLALLVPEAVFWVGFALPIPWPLAAARVASILRRPRTDS